MDVGSNTKICPIENSYSDFGKMDILSLDPYPLTFINPNSSHQIQGKLQSPFLRTLVTNLKECTREFLIYFLSV